ncbi:MAG: hypothetical protein DMD81_26440 [Candidatus Rokuibacteriota bacterium]|nr:MAG: hypothetical protein DMD81_26440 [Candidatus Rokubacteria bacterium]
MPPSLALAVVTLGHALGSFAVLSVAPLSPYLVDALHLSRAQVGWLLPAVYLGGVLMSLPSGWLTDRLGVRLTLSFGLTVIGLMLAIATLSGTLAPLLVCLVLAGFGFSVLNPATGKAIGLTMGGVIASLVLPAVAHDLGWRAALWTAAAVALGCAVFVALSYRAAPVVGVTRPAARPRLGELSVYLRRPGVIVVFVCGFALSIVQSSLLAYLALFAKETLSVSAIVAGQLLALAQIGGTAGRLGWGFISDRYFGSRRRPGIVVNALFAAGAYLLFAFGARLPLAAFVPLAFVAGAGAFGWVGLYFALVAEIGGARHAGLLTGVSVMFAWSGVLVGPPLFGLLLEASGGYAVPWLTLVAVAAAVAIGLPRPQPLVQREPESSRLFARVADVSDDRAASS